MIPKTSISIIFNENSEHGAIFNQKKNTYNFNQSFLFFFFVFFFVDVYYCKGVIIIAQPIAHEPNTLDDKPETKYLIEKNKLHIDRPALRFYS